MLRKKSLFSYGKNCVILMGKANFPRGYTALRQTLLISYMRKQKGWVQRMFNLENSGINEMPAEENSTDVDLEALVIRLPGASQEWFLSSMQLKVTGMKTLPAC